MKSGVKTTVESLGLGAPDFMLQLTLQKQKLVDKERL
jgi:hypothetical protein